MSIRVKGIAMLSVAIAVSAYWLLGPNADVIPDVLYGFLVFYAALAGTFWLAFGERMFPRADYQRKPIFIRFLIWLIEDGPLMLPLMFISSFLIIGFTQIIAWLIVLVFLPIFALSIVVWPSVVIIRYMKGVRGRDLWE